MPSLLFEIGCEELPASACREAEAQLPKLAELHLGMPPARVLVGPRRLALLVDGLPLRTPDEWVKGPPVELREQAAAGFARRHGVDPVALEVRDGFLGLTVRGQDLAAVLPERLAAIVRGLQFSKSMTWGQELRFSRPVRWLCAKLDRETVIVGLDAVPSGGESRGHRFTAGPVAIPSAEEYLPALRAAGVEPDQDVRRATIEQGLDALGDWTDPLGKLAEVVHLVESPAVLEGRFADRFLRLPERVIVTAMQSHQRYFPLGETRFAVVANGGEADAILPGYAAVLENRLEDAGFTFDRDVGRGIDALAQQLDSIMFVAGGGSFADKTVRLVKLVEALGGGEPSMEAARLAKADQAAELVREFPDLEGQIGAEYARLAGYSPAVCDAIGEQYLPDSAGGPLPATEAGRLLAVAEKVDNLTVAFALGERPSGTRDPYGLRRAAIGLCRIAVDRLLLVDVERLSALAFRLLVEQGAAVDESPARDVAEFVLDRLEGLVEVPVEFLRAARGSGQRHVHQVARLAQALAAFEASDLSAVHTVFTRADRLAGRAEGEAASELRADLLVEDTEREVGSVLTTVDAEIAEALESEDYRRALRSAVSLAEPLERFFEDVLVMADDASVRANRLRLLLDVRETVGQLGDFAQIPL